MITFRLEHHCVVIRGLEYSCNVVIWTIFQQKITSKTKKMTMNQETDKFLQGTFPLLTQPYVSHISFSYGYSVVSCKLTCDSISFL